MRTITAPAGPSAAREGRARGRADQAARVLQRVDRRVGLGPDKVHETDGRQAREHEPDPEAPAPAGALLGVFVVDAEAGHDQRERPDDQRDRQEEPAATEHDRRAVLDGPPERTGQIGVDAERRDDTDHGEHDRQGVGPVGPQLLVYVVTPGGPDRDATTTRRRGPPP